jgi:hypothetical protein
MRTIWVKSSIFRSGVSAWLIGELAKSRLGELALVMVEAGSVNGGGSGPATGGAARKSRGALGGRQGFSGESRALFLIPPRLARDTCGYSVAWRVRRILDVYAMNRLFRDRDTIRDAARDAADLSIPPPALRVVDRQRILPRRQP